MRKRSRTITVQAEIENVQREGGGHVGSEVTSRTETAGRMRGRRDAGLERGIGRDGAETGCGGGADLVVDVERHGGDRIHGQVVDGIHAGIVAAFGRGQRTAVRARSNGREHGLSVVVCYGRLLWSMVEDGQLYVSSFGRMEQCSSYDDLVLGSVTDQNFVGYSGWVVIIQENKSDNRVGNFVFFLPAGFCGR